MSEIACPQCGQSVVVVASLAGQMVGCPRCQLQFIMPGPPTPPPIPAVISVYQSGVSQKFRPAKSIFDVFDFRFETYVTPIIIRTTWVLALLAAFLLAAISLYKLFVPHDEARYEFEVPAFMSQNSRGPSTSGPKPLTDEELRAIRERSRLIEGFVELGFQLIATSIVLLWVRVALETTIVIFNIAASLSSLDRKTKP